MGRDASEPSPDNIIHMKDQFYILATSPLVGGRTQVLKQGDTFAVFDRCGDVRPAGFGEQGIYHEGTRFLSRLKLKLGEARPLLLNSTVKEDNVTLATDLTNPDIYVDGKVVVARGTLHIFRSKFLWRGICYECLEIQNYGRSPVDVPLSFIFGADFADVFEVRGLEREQRGQQLEAAVEEGGVTFAYEGLDGVIRRTELECEPVPNEISPSEARFGLKLRPKGKAKFFLTVRCELDGAAPSGLSYDEAFAQAKEALKAAKARNCEIFTSNEQFNDWLNRSMADLYMMVTDTPSGPYPYAGVPWFNTAFGRDGIITALESLWVNPGIARGVLSYLASTQAKENVPEEDAEPGKILHETRKGEMAAVGEIPFARYYGSVDATPLFVVLAGAYYERTGDRSFVDSIWPNIELALEWIDAYGDLDDDGFVEYVRRSPRGLLHQGWKDSKDSVFHSDGSLAEGPIAPCEVQGYVYGAKRRAAELASVLGREGRAEKLLRQSQVLQERFEEAFWCEKLSTYALALDGSKRPCRVKTSNAGHCLFAGIADQKHARRTARTLLDEDSFSGWGVRTVAASEVRYNPMSYHNGSVWPHDNALIAYGLARYGFKEMALKILTGIFDSTLFLDLHRLPELFCGFRRRRGEGPTLYPLACAPQSWSIASVFLLLQSCLGLSIDGPKAQVRFSHPVLPEFLQKVQIKNLEVGKASVDLSLERHERDVGINITRKEGRVNVEVVK